MGTTADYHVLEGTKGDSGKFLKEKGDELVLGFNPPNDILLSGPTRDVPILSFRVENKTGSQDLRVKIHIGNRFVFDKRTFPRGLTIINEPVKFADVTTGNQFIHITNESNDEVGISKVIMWFKRR